MIQKSVGEVAMQAVSMPGALGCEMQMLAGPQDGCGNFAMRKFTVAAGGHTPLHKHDY